MPNDTTAALQALLRQVQTLTERLDGLQDFNSRVLDEKKDVQRQLEAVKKEQQPPKKSLIDIVDDEIHERKMRAANLEKDADGNWYPQGVKPKHSLTREEARDPRKYAAAKEAAAKAGATLTVINEGIGDPTRQSHTQIAKTRVSVIKDDDAKRVYIRKDVFGTREFQEQYKQLRANGYTPVSWAQTDDLPPHMQTKHRLQERAANADN